MKRFLVLLSVVAAVISSSAIVAGAGLGEPPAPAPATFGYTIVLFTSEPLEEGTSGTTEDSGATASDVGAFDASVFDLSDGVQPLQGDGCELMRVDFATGALTAVSPSASFEACAGDLAFAPDGTLYGIVEVADGLTDFTHLVSFDTTTGAVTDLGQITEFPSFAGFSEAPVGGITADAAGTLFVALGVEEGGDPSCDAFCLYRIDDPANPEAATFVGPISDEAFVSTLAASCSTVYVGEFVDAVSMSEVHTVDTATGATTAIGGLGEDRFLYGADFDNAGTFWSIVLIPEVDEISFFVATLNPAGGTPIETLGAEIPAPEDGVFLNALTVEPLDCTPEPIVLEPTFTG